MKRKALFYIITISLATILVITGLYYTGNKRPSKKTSQDLREKLTGLDEIKKEIQNSKSPDP
ncbi:MAG: hypothetical protein J7M18_07455 [Candidatus Eremiobacteraeota bacterium]|nr:hypothetical protein [Candidatus Eremiobacteraeota bacterium]